MKRFIPLLIVFPFLVFGEISNSSKMPGLIKVESINDSIKFLLDAMYDSTSKPYVSHFTGNSLMHEYIERNVCPTMLSSDFTGQKKFRFKNDKRPVVKPKIKIIEDKIENQ